jgi:hypothetical protein
MFFVSLSPLILAPTMEWLLIIRKNGKKISFFNWNAKLRNKLEVAACF